MKTLLRLGELVITYGQPDPPIPALQPGWLAFQCNICGQVCQKPLASLVRDQSSCDYCLSSHRFRAVIHLLSSELFGKSLTLPDFPARPDLKGLGLSDWSVYAESLAQKFDYTNTFYHTEPRLDITDIDPALEGSLDFLIASDVFEHVMPPVSRAFVNAYRLLKPGGVFIFTVPYGLQPATAEHFPDLYDYQIVRRDNLSILENTTRDGRQQSFDNLVFHGGDGATLEMRVFSEASLKEEFARAGFQSMKIQADPVFEFGIYFSKPWSLPITARK